MTVLPTAPAQKKGWLPLVLIAILTVAIFIVSVISLLSGWLAIFQNLFYFPIILACVYYVRRGFVFSVLLACGYFLLMAIFSQDPVVLQSALIRVMIFILIAGVITYLCIIRLRAEEALRASEIRYRRLFETTQDGILIIDADTGKIVDANPFLIDLLGLPHEQFIGKILWEIELFKDIVANKDNFIELYRQEYIRYEDLPLETANGRQIDVEFVSNVYTVDNKKNIQCNIRDITERKTKEKALNRMTEEVRAANLRLKDLDHLKSLFIASMSHELRTPLNSIIGFTGIMVKGMAGEINPEQKKQLGMVQDSARHLLALINDLIDFSRIEAGKIEANVSTFDLVDVLREIRNTIGTVAAEQGLILNIEIPGPILVTSDDRRIKQIILNLVSNAIKFSDEGRIDVTVQQKGEIVEVSVSDTGIGIRPEDLAQLFRPFVRVMVPGRHTEGTGFGLYLSKKIARFLGGDIAGKSEMHKGSVFTFSFPIVYAKQEEV